MKPASLKEKLLELYQDKNINIDEELNQEDMMRCVRTYLRKKYDDKKIQRILEDINLKYNLAEESRGVKRKAQLSQYIDSIVMSRIRDSYKTSKELDIDSLDELKFKALVKQVVVHFGYDTLFTPLNSTNSIDIIVHRKDIKIAVLALKAEKNSFITLKAIRRLRYIANYYHCEQALLVTNAYFDSEAIEEASAISVTLLNRDKLIPLIKDLIDGRQKEDIEYLIDDMEKQENAIFLEGEIKFPKTKVQVVYVKYYIDEATDLLFFEGKLINTGKRSAANVHVEIKLFNRNNDNIYTKVFPVEKGKLESKEEISFKFSFNEILKDDWKDLCRYQLKLEYKNTYKD